MSETFTIKNIEIKDMEALKKACDILKLEIKQGTVNFYSSQEKGINIKLPGWKYPIVIKETGEIAYDNYNGKWGDTKEIYKLLGYYGNEKAKSEAYKLGHSCFENYNKETNELEMEIIIEENL